MCFPMKMLYGPFFSPMHPTCPAHLIILDLMIQIISGKDYKIWSSFLYSFLHPPSLPHHPVLKHTQSIFFPKCERQSFTPRSSGNHDDRTCSV
jgi:hypothetical protein